MKTYWDLSEKERAALSRGEVEMFVNAELMSKGVLRPRPITLVEIEEVVLPTERFFRVGGGRHGTNIPLAFRSEQDARTFMTLGVVSVDNDWQLDRKEYVEPLDLESRGKISIVELPTRESVESAKAALKKVAADRDENERRVREHRDAQKKVDDALSGLWEDWYACGAKATRVAEVASTFEEYVGMCGGDRAMAKKFMYKTFSAERLREFDDWGGGANFFVEEAAPEPEPAPAADEHESPVF